MTFVTQEFLHRPEEGQIGDCLRAGVASVLGLELSEVPHFVEIGLKRGDRDQEEDPGMEWWNAMQAWLALRNLECWGLENLELVEHSKFEHILVVGKAERPNGTFEHACVGTVDGEVVHDPHPSRAGLVAVSGYLLITKLGTWASISG